LRFLEFIGVGVGVGIGVEILKREKTVHLPIRMFFESIPMNFALGIKIPGKHPMPQPGICPGTGYGCGL
jgi:hypothetical protein